MGSCRRAVNTQQGWRSPKSPGTRCWELSIRGWSELLRQSHTCNRSALKAGTGGLLWFWGELGLYSKFSVSCATLWDTISKSTANGKKNWAGRERELSQNLRIRSLLYFIGPFLWFSWFPTTPSHMVNFFHPITLQLICSHFRLFPTRTLNMAAFRPQIVKPASALGENSSTVDKNHYYFSIDI